MQIARAGADEEDLAVGRWPSLCPLGQRRTANGQLLGSRGNERLINGVDQLLRIGAALPQANRPVAIDFSKECADGDAVADRGMNSDRGVAVEQVTEFLQNAALEFRGERARRMIDRRGNLVRAVSQG